MNADCDYMNADCDYMNAIGNYANANVAGALITFK